MNSLYEFDYLVEDEDLRIKLRLRDRSFRKRYDNSCEQAINKYRALNGVQETLTRKATKEEEDFFETLTTRKVNRFQLEFEDYKSEKYEN